MKFKKAKPKISGVYLIKFETNTIEERYELVTFNAKTKTVSDYPKELFNDDVCDVYCLWGDLIEKYSGEGG